MVKKKFIIVIIIFLFLFFVTGCNNNLSGNVVVDSVKNQTHLIKIGAILPLSGPASVWGDTAKNGMDIAKEELERKGYDLEIIYEDSKGEAVGGINSYNKLVNLDNVDYVVTFFSRVSIPISKRAVGDDVGVVMSMVAAEDATNIEGKVFRYFSTPKQYARAFENILESKNYKKIAIAYVNDDYGLSVNTEIENMANEIGLDVVLSEGYDSFATDYKTFLNKAKFLDVDAVMFVSTVPLEIISVLQDKNNLKIDMDIFDVSLNLPAVIDMGDYSQDFENVYSLSYYIAHEGNFSTNYNLKYNSKPLFTSALGYDIINMIANDVLDLKNEYKYSGELGDVLIEKTGEINPKLKVVKIKKGEIVDIN